MKKTILSMAIICILFGSSKAQKSWNAGAGYFGHTASYPGIIFEAERIVSASEQKSMHLKLATGYYIHKRYNNGLFLDASYGFRHSFKSGFFLEQYAGIGLIQTFLNADAVYTTTGDGTFTKTHRRGSLDLMPSLQFGTGFSFNNDWNIWVRPKVYWQFPHKTTSLYNFAIQIGMSVPLK